ncbi:MAG: NYN domain-containing protein [Chloroflexi bacterium]|nr:NYN domain-containing protein [Chloroflexota bacterium]MCL5025346.1 NYN domain-containing protein [Chloroflexota bacterium]
MNGCETETGRRYVALFIDWDNLAISTSADMGGALPDLGRIVQKAREVGTILVAKAYAEWSVTSERLAVYRAGVEPAYAPTFRFEPDPSAPNIRSKSLADPCMVADCIEALHLLPLITDFVIVTGDKDLIPVVRLAQLRGKHVTVIGPDFSANVLKEMADTFVSYRSLVEEGDGRVAVGRERHGARGEKALGEPIAEARRSPRSSARPAEPTVPLQPARGQARPEPAPRSESGPRPLHRPAPAPSATPAAAAVVPEPTIIVEAVPRPAPPKEDTAPPSDVNVVFSSIVDLLKQRAAEGKTRVRATAIKDALLQAFPGFNERAYGYTKFKDLLDAVQRAGLINIIRVGPVHWATLASKPQAGTLTPPPAAEARPESVVSEPLGPTAPEPGAVMPSEERSLELIRFILDLRNRSRWLTYTYVLTNLSTMLSETMPAAAAEKEARDLLNALVEQGILRVDAEPREIDVNGTKHRIRMCHLVETHPLVARVLQEAAPSAEPEVSLLGEPIAAAEPTPVEDEVRAGPEAGPEFPAAALAQPETERAAVEGVTMGLPTVPQETRPEAATAEEPTATMGAAPGEQPAEQPAQRGDGRSRRRGSRGGARRRARPAAEAASPVEAQAAEEAEGEGASPQPAGQEEGPTPARAEPAAGPAPVLAEAQPIAGPAAEEGTGRETAFQVLARLVAENVNDDRPRLRAPGLKQRLMRALGHFDEREYGFARFGDFLDAAQQAGYLVVQREGSAVWVSLPAAE